jgi:hypothetical protein
MRQMRCDGVRATIVGTPGNDYLEGTRRRDVIHGLGGSDSIVWGPGNDKICGGGGVDYLSGGTNRLGAGGEDAFYGGRATTTFLTVTPRRDYYFVDPSGSDSFYGNEGHDVLYSTRTADHVDGGPGNDEMGRSLMATPQALKSGRATAGRTSTLGVKGTTRLLPLTALRTTMRSGETRALTPVEPTREMRSMAARISP